MNMHTVEDLKQFQNLPLKVKVAMTKARIRTWIEEYGEDGVYVSFSGGKDSTVLLRLVRDEFPNVPAVFCDTGLEFPEIREFVKSFDNVVWLKPRLNFRQVVEKYGYPIISKDVAQSVFDVKTQATKLGCDKRKTKIWEREFSPDSEYGKKFPSYSKARYDFLNDAPFDISHRCCNEMKKHPAKEYEKETGRKAILGTMACESRLRQTQWLKEGCNAFDAPRPTSKPMSFWTEQDVLMYIKENDIPICSVYGDIVSAEEEIIGQMDICDLGLCQDWGQLKTTGQKRTGCMFCLFGCTARDWDNLRKMKETHPKTYDYLMRPKEEGGMNYKEIIDWLNEHGDLNIKY